MRELQRRYLEALEIPVWVPRAAEMMPGAVPDRIRLGPGSGASLFICSGPEASSSLLAADIVRALPEPPVWAWPEDVEDAMAVGAAVKERLFSSIIVFGEELASRLFGPGCPESVGSARLVIAPAMSALAGSPHLRRACWRLLVSGHFVRRS